MFYRPAPRVKSVAVAAHRSRFAARTGKSRMTANLRFRKDACNLCIGTPSSKCDAAPIWLA
jgi:hypothetical protein